MCNCGFCTETDDTNHFWADVYYHMIENNCDQDTAIKEVMNVYLQRF